MPNVFISHSSEDSEIANKLADFCRQSGLSVFLDENNLNPGDDWYDRIHQEIAASDAVWVLASKKAIESGMVNQEIGATKAHGVKLVPIIWDMPPEELPVPLNQIQAIVLTDKTPEEGQALFADLINQAIRSKRIQTATAYGVVGLVCLALLMD